MKDKIANNALISTDIAVEEGGSLTGAPAFMKDKVVSNALLFTDIAVEEGGSLTGAQTAPAAMSDSELRVVIYGYTQRSAKLSLRLCGEIRMGACLAENTHDAFFAAAHCSRGGLRSSRGAPVFMKDKVVSNVLLSTDIAVSGGMPDGEY